MPQVPKYEAPTVNSGAPHDFRSYATGEAFGTGIAQGMGALASALERGGDMLARQALAQQQLDNEIAAKEADNQFNKEASDLFYNPETGYLTRKGKDAAEGFGPTMDRLDEIDRRIAKGLPNDAARKAYLSVSRSRRNFFYQEGGRYAAREKKAYEIGTISSRIDNLADDGLRSWADDAQFAKVETAIEAEARERARLEGWSPEQTEDYVRSVKDKLIQNRINAAAYADPEQAQKIFDANKDKLTVTGRMNSETQIERARKGQLAKEQLATWRAERSLASDIMSIGKTGISQITEADEPEIKRLVGEKRFEEWKQGRLAARVIYENAGDSATLSPEQMQERLAKLAPRPSFKELPGEKARGYTVSRATIEAYIREAARARGIDPEVAVRVYKTEGVNDWQSLVDEGGTREPSYGPFQLLFRQDGRKGGVGNLMFKETKVDPRDPNNWRESIDYALNHAAKHGWGDWMGARGAGIVGRTGIGPNARPVAIYDRTKEKSESGLDFAGQQAVYEAVEKAFQDTLRLRATDPALSVDDSPLVQEAMRNAKPDDPASMQNIFQARMEAQKAAGIDPDAQTPISVREAEILMRPLKTMLPGMEAETFASIAQNMRAKYGEYWEKAFIFGLKNSRNRLSQDQINIAVDVMKEQKKILDRPTPTKKTAEAPPSASPTERVADEAESEAAEKIGAQLYDSPIGPPMADEAEAVRAASEAAATRLQRGVRRQQPATQPEAPPPKVSPSKIILEKLGPKSVKTDTVKP